LGRKGRPPRMSDHPELGSGSLDKIEYTEVIPKVGGRGFIWKRARSLEGEERSVY